MIPKSVIAVEELGTLQILSKIAPPPQKKSLNLENLQRVENQI